LVYDGLEFLFGQGIRHLPIELACVANTIPYQQVMECSTRIEREDHLDFIIVDESFD